MSEVARFRYVSSIEVARTDQESLTDMVWANAERFGDTVSFRRRVADSWLDVTAVADKIGAKDLAAAIPEVIPG